MRWKISVSRISLNRHIASRRGMTTPGYWSTGCGHVASEIGGTNRSLD
jgi:hypothetical protein